MSQGTRVLILLAAAAACALGVWQVRASDPEVSRDRALSVPSPSPASVDEQPPPASVTAETREQPPVPAEPAKEPRADVGPKRVRLDPVVAPTTKPRDLTNEQLWKLGLSGSPDVGIPRRIEALQELLKRSITTEERVQALSQLASTYRADISPRQVQQIEALQEVLRLAGEESEMGHRATVQLGWPLWELGRKQEAYDTVLPLTTSPHATERYRGLAHWAALVFALGLEKWDEAERHYADLKATKDPALHGTRVLASQRVAAARRKRRR